ncbi:hypothetical protein E1H12_10970 [Geitlerinema sp. P-1104]|uniref:hypothetical protein n=1 Tax=Cyanophyceae TaxID=3028117 RepID=UPI0014776D0B|nr:hypothetical protein [Geitlerinema sp. P-1104]NMG59024.1 hypothetical protein [Geitlerinema sp. P-1104]
MLKPQDVVILLKVHCWQGDWTYEQLALSLKTSTSVVYESLKRCEVSRLYHRNHRQVMREALLEFLVHGVKYVFPATVGNLKRGIPTAHSAELLKSLLVVSEPMPYVWAFSRGKVKGQEIKPLYKQLPEIIGNDRRFYELVCLVDALRIGKVREQELAITVLKERLYG